MQEVGTKIFNGLESLGIVKYSGGKNIYGLNPIIISGLIIGITILLANTIRKLVKSVVAEGFARDLVLEIVATAELSACCFELAVVAQHFGLAAYAVFFFVLSLWWASVWGSATACPIAPIQDALENSRDFKEVLLLIIFQVLGGILIFAYSQAIWTVEMSQTHIGKAQEKCTADLSVHILLGALIEGFATFLCQIVSRIIQANDNKYASVINSLVGTTLVVLAFNFSGGYFNPALATSLQYGCEGLTFIGFTIVYWIAPILGAVAAIYVCNLEAIKTLLDPNNEKED